MADKIYLKDIPITDFVPSSTKGIVMFQTGGDNDGFSVEYSTQFVSQSDLTEEASKLALKSEGVLNLPSKYFTPVDNGSGGLQLSGITFDEVQEEYNRYQGGLVSIQTNTNGFINLTVDNFTINEDIINFQYRWAIADYTNGVINVYQALISATTGGIITPVNLLHSYVLQPNE